MPPETTRSDREYKVHVYELTYKGECISYLSTYAYRPPDPGCIHTLRAKDGPTAKRRAEKAHRTDCMKINTRSRNDA